MNRVPTRTEWANRTCTACEGGIDPIDPETARQYLASLPEWTFDEDGRTIQRKINAGNFVRAISHVNAIAALAEIQQHHPDLHLTGYRHLRIVLTTHAVGGLTENDFILAAQVDQIFK